MSRMSYIGGHYRDGSCWLSSSSCGADASDTRYMDCACNHSPLPCSLCTAGAAATAAGWLVTVFMLLLQM